MSFSTCLVIMAGGALGTLARYLISVLALPISGNLPWGTILINIVGSFVIGFFGTLTLAHGRFPVSENIRLFVMIGLCGGFTTMSTFMYEMSRFAQDSEYWVASGYFAATLAGCGMAFWLGSLAIRLWMKG